MINVYAGFDPREEIGYHTFTSSLVHRASEPVAVCPLHIDTLREVGYSAGHRDGTNAFIYSRFLVPYLQDYSGFALFVDGADMIVKGDIAELWAMRCPFKAVQVIKHEYRTRHQRKYVGTPMEAANADYPRKNWSSVMLINCAHYAWRQITPEKLDKMTGAQLHRFEFIPERFIGELPAEWNWLADEYGPNPAARLLHWTAGIPAWDSYKAAPHADDWRRAHERVNAAC